MAQTKGQTAEVKTYGNHMVTDHTMAETELATLVSTKGLNLPQSLLSHHQNNLNILQNQVPALEFDLRFAELMVISHQEAVNLFQSASQPNGISDPELRTWAANKLPSLQMHLQEAVTLYNSIKANQ